MTREEEIIQMSKKIALEDWHEGQASYFEAKEYLRKGAEWADQHPRKGLWDAQKVIEWLRANIDNYANYNVKTDECFVDDFEEDLCKAME